METTTAAVYNVTGNASPCGLPPFCSSDAIFQCQKTPLKDCPACSKSSAAGILSFLIIMGVLTVIGNILVLLVTASIEKKKKTKRDYAKMSLAVIDFIKGLNMLAVACPHLIKALDSTVYDLYMEVELSRRSVLATALGVLTIFIFTSSLNHLLYMSVQRFLAVQFPFKYRQVTTNQTILQLAAVWVISVVTASVMAWNHSSNNFVYHPSLFQYFFALLESSLFYYELVPMAVLFFGPCLFMIITTIVTTHLACCKVRRSARALRREDSTTKILKQHLWMFRITLSMNISFIAGIVPGLGVFISFYNGSLTCSSVSVPFFIGFYLGCSTGLLDVIVYSVYDRHFRTEVYNFMAKACHSKQHPPVRQRQGFSPKTTRATNAV